MSVNSLKIGLLGIPDSTSTQALITELKHQGIEPNFYIFWKPSFSQNLKRVRLMLGKYGMRALIDAVVYAILSRISWKNSKSIYYVPHHNSEQTRNILISQKPDILILSTNTIIKKEIFSIPRLVTLNAHPAWLPTFRGMGSSHYQLKAGYHLAVSIHAVDDGIDSGPIYARESIELDLSSGIEELRCLLFGIKPDIHRLMAKLLRKVIEDFQSSRAKPIDCSMEPNSLFRGGMGKEELKELDQLLRAKKIPLAYVKNTL